MQRVDAFIKKDIYAGLTVALLVLPQAMGNALIVGVPISAGLFAATYGTMIAALFCANRHLVGGSTGATAVLIAGGISQVMHNHYAAIPVGDQALVTVHLMMQLTFLAGIIQIVSGLLGIGSLTERVSHTVIIGYITGAALAVIANQTFLFMGIPRMTGFHSLAEQGRHLVSHLSVAHGPTVLLGVASVLTLLLLRRLKPRVPHAICMLAVATLFGAANASISKVGDLGPLSEVWPSFTWPYLDPSVLPTLLPIAFVLAALGNIETATISRTVAMRSGDPIDLNQDFMGIGAANVLSGLIGALPSSGSPSRTMVNHACGAQTRLSPIISGFVVIAVLLLLEPVVAMIPLTALAGLLLLTALTQIIHPTDIILCFSRGPAQAAVYLATVGTALIYTLDTAFYVGLLLSLGAKALDRILAPAGAVRTSPHPG
jgi:SulP family sulfate permease